MKCAAVKKLSAFWSPGGRENREPPRANDFLGETMPSLSPSKPSSVARKNKNEIQKKKRAFRNPYDDYYTLYTMYTTLYE